jgi:hypothetical protein
MKEAAKRSTMRFATHRAMAIVDQLDTTIELEFHLPAKTGTMNHRETPS